MGSPIRSNKKCHEKNTAAGAIKNLKALFFFAEDRADPAESEETKSFGRCSRRDKGAQKPGTFDVREVGVVNKITDAKR
jgi:hypothetical protein